MPKDKGDKATPSADEIIEALALEMGVEDEAGGGGSAKARSATAKSEASRPESKAPPAKPPRAPGGAPSTGSKPPASPKGTISRESDSKVVFIESEHRGHLRYGGDLDLNDEHVIDSVFSMSGHESVPSDAYVGDYYVDDLDDRVTLGSGYVRSALQLLIVLAITAVLILLVVFVFIPQEYRRDIGPLLAGEDIQAQRRERRRQEAAEERRRWLESRPKYGNLTVLTRPGFSRVIVDSQPQYVEHPNNESWLVETRSGTSFQNLDIREHYVLTISLPNYQERRIELYPYDQANSLWQQRVDDGAYYLELNEILEPSVEAAPELMARMTPTLETPDLTGTITVRTEPQGARVLYNNRLLVDENGQPLTTPVTFTSYPPPPPEPAVDGSQPVEAPTEPIPVTLRATGVPIRVELEGYMPVATGVYRHMFLCEPTEGVAEDAPFWERCTYTYDTGVIQLVTPEEFHPPGEGSGEGTGQTADLSSSG